MCEKKVFKLRSKYVLLKYEEQNIFTYINISLYFSNRKC